MSWHEVVVEATVQTVVGLPAPLERVTRYWAPLSWPAGAVHPTVIAEPLLAVAVAPVVVSRLQARARAWFVGAYGRRDDQKAKSAARRGQEEPEDGEADGGAGGLHRWTVTFTGTWKVAPWQPLAEEVLMSTAPGMWTVMFAPAGTEMLRSVRVGTETPVFEDVQAVPGPVAPTGVGSCPAAQDPRGSPS